nr:erythrocyte band 7 integral membrane protein isoform X1 [Misgurnus anguillicaudatus]
MTRTVPSNTAERLPVAHPVKLVCTTSTVYNTKISPTMEDGRESAAMKERERKERQIDQWCYTVDDGRGLENADSDIGLCGWILVVFSILLTLLTLPLSIWMCIKIVKEYERAIIFRLGRILRGGAKGPGLFLILPCTDSFINVDMRTITFDIPPQEVLTKDSVTVSVDGVVYYRVQNATLAVANITNADAATRLLAQTTLRNVLGTKNLSEILSDREEIAHSMQSTLDDATDDWGIKVERVEIKDVKLPQQLQRAMAAEAEAAREARAKVIAAEGEMNASRALKEASLVIAESPSGLQLRYLQTLNTIAAEKNSTIIFPLPIDMIQSFMKH